VTGRPKPSILQLAVEVAVKKGMGVATVFLLFNRAAEIHYAELFDPHEGARA
jgi:hypothetical protein